MPDRAVTDEELVMLDQAEQFSKLNNHDLKHLLLRLNHDYKQAGNFKLLLTITFKAEDDAS